MKSSFVACALSLIASCSLFVSLDGLDNKGGANGSDGSVPAGSSPCTVTHDLCDDFDAPGETAGNAPIWSGVDNQAPPGTVGLSTDLFLSSPRSFSAVYAAGTVPYDSEGVYRTFSGPVASAHCELDYRIEAMDGNSLVAISLNAKVPGGALNVGWNVINGGSQTLLMNLTPDDGGGAASTYSNNAEPPALHRWFHIAVDMKAPTSGAISVTLFIDGVQTLQMTSPISFASAEDLTFEIGALHAQTNTQSDNVLFDNVFCDLK